MTDSTLAFQWSRSVFTIASGHGQHAQVCTQQPCLDYAEWCIRTLWVVNGCLVCKHMIMQHNLYTDLAFSHDQGCTVYSMHAFIPFPHNQCMHAQCVIKTNFLAQKTSSHIIAFSNNRSTYERQHPSCSTAHPFHYKHTITCTLHEMSNLIVSVMYTK